MLQATWGEAPQAPPPPAFAPAPAPSQPPRPCAASRQAYVFKRRVQCNSVRYSSKEARAAASTPQGRCQPRKQSEAYKRVITTVHYSQSRRRPHLSSPRTILCLRKSLHLPSPIKLLLRLLTVSLPLPLFWQPLICHTFPVAVEDADDAAVRNINCSASSEAASDKPRARSSPSLSQTSSSSPFVHQADEQIVRVEKSAGCVAQRCSARTCVARSRARLFQVQVRPQVRHVRVQGDSSGAHRAF